MECVSFVASYYTPSILPPIIEPNTKHKKTQTTPGDLYSVKIMWPRTDEERARGRNTGFVCFMTREDAQDAMDAYGESDPLNTGRRMMLRWGKNVKKTVKRGTGGVPIAPIRRSRARTSDNDGKDGSRLSKSISCPSSKSSNAEHPKNNDATENEALLSANQSSHSQTKTSTVAQQHQKHTHKPEFVPTQDLPTAINVVVPQDPNRLKFITTVASFVSKDGSILERKIMDRESNNPQFAFLFPPDHHPEQIMSTTAGACNSSETIQDERIFYRWRVYTFTQGDMNNAWNTKPFQMFRGGRWWIPPPLVDREAAQLEEDRLQKREQDILQKKEERKKAVENINAATVKTGRQLEHVKFGASNVVKLTAYEKEQFSKLLRRLCASRESICEVMVFCFEKSGSAVEIANMLRDSLLDVRVSVDTRIARLYLLSDVLFNSQQPGVRNAFRYRDAVEQMAPKVFGSMGNENDQIQGRMSMNKLRRAVQKVLAAWAHWSVYTQEFIQELEARFEGTPIETNQQQVAADVDIDVDGEDLTEDEVTAAATAETQTESTKADAPSSAKTSKPIGGWKVVDSNATSKKSSLVANANGGRDGTVSLLALVDDDLDGEPLVEGDVDMPLSKFFEMYGMVY